MMFIQTRLNICIYLSFIINFSNLNIKQLIFLWKKGKKSLNYLSSVNSPGLSITTWLWNEKWAKQTDVLFWNRLTHWILKLFNLKKILQWYLKHPIYIVASWLTFTFVTCVAQYSKLSVISIDIGTTNNPKIWINFYDKKWCKFYGLTKLLSFFFFFIKIHNKTKKNHQNIK